MYLEKNNHRINYSMIPLFLLTKELVTKFDLPADSLVSVSTLSFTLFQLLLFSHWALLEICVSFQNPYCQSQRVLTNQFAGNYNLCISCPNFLSFQSAWFIPGCLLDFLTEHIYSLIKQILLRIYYVPSNVLCISLLSALFFLATVISLWHQDSLKDQYFPYVLCTGGLSRGGKNHFQSKVYDENRYSIFQKH